MQACHDSSPRTQRFFVVTAYQATERGFVKPVRPTHCPHRGDAADCRVVLHDWRKRHTGPEHRLAVLRCTTHQRSFTVYPPGYVPYARKPWLRLAPDGTPLRSPDTATGRCEETGFDAARDAAQGLAWPRRTGEEFFWCPARQDMQRVDTQTEGPVWSTQGRQLERALALMGLLTAGDDARVEHAQLLGLDALTLKEASTSLTQGYRSRGHAVCCLLDATTPRGLCERLAEAGFLVGLWGAPYRVDPERRVLRRRPFQTSGIPPPLA